MVKNSSSRHHLKQTGLPKHIIEYSTNIVFYLDRKAYGSKVHLLNLAVYLLGLLPLTYLILNLRPSQNISANGTSVIMVPVSFSEVDSFYSELSSILYERDELKEFCNLCNRGQLEMLICDKQRRER